MFSLKGNFVHSVKRFIPKVRRYLRENPGAGFVLGFQILLLACAGLLLIGNSMLANEVGIYAYYLLVIGVILQLISFLRHKEESVRKSG